jgi:hypothetical protein
VRHIGTAPPASVASRPPALVVRAGLHGDGTCLALSDGEVLQLPSLPDPDGPSRVHAVLRRVGRVQLVVDDGAVVALVHGVGHRRRCRLQISTATALALALDGVPTTVTVLTPPSIGDDAERGGGA